jgi:hypothetical protein
MQNLKILISQRVQEMLDFCSEHNIVCEIERIGIDGVNDALVGASGGAVVCAAVGAAGAAVAAGIWRLWALWHCSVEAARGALLLACGLLPVPVAALLAQWLPSCRTAWTRMHAPDFYQCATLLPPTLPCSLQDRLEKNDVRGYRFVIDIQGSLVA